MKVLKFGGTSVGSPERMKQVANLIKTEQGKKIVVLSAVSGTTNSLVALGELCENKKKEEALQASAELLKKYHAFIDELYSTDESKKASIEFVNQVFVDIDGLIEKRFQEQVAKLLVVQGEIISTRLFTTYLQEIGYAATMIMAQDFMTLDKYNEPDLKLIQKKLEQILPDVSDDIIITQGFIARNKAGGIDNLQRGGSDYSATIIGSVLGVEEVQIWTDIDGMHNNDPRIVKNTRPVSKLSFEEASELAYFGAKVLHPHCIVPAHQYSVPVRIKNTMDPGAFGTLISTESETAQTVKAIAAKDGITAIKIKSSRMVMAYGFLKKIFEVFEKYETPIDMITTSEIAVSLTIDNATQLRKITKEISEYGTVEIDKDQTIVCVVGDLIAEKKGVGSVLFQSLDEVPIRMISYGGSRNNISLLVASEHKADTLSKLHAALF
ncbi:aspartate kinase [Marinoscillum sp. MHG1-6]|uniref:aspartate kinase n=1 Tax=Marinoscillum sp. MHG1-6 TaxID=2959627 RepID=UPI00215757B5|nr:aspartate kinase [Marinoscillum sp. MHG1-6]